VQQGIPRVKGDLKRVLLENDKIHYQNKHPYKIFVTPKARFSRKVCFKDTLYNDEMKIIKTLLFMLYISNIM
jgi:hypothetical protein